MKTRIPHGTYDDDSYSHICHSWSCGNDDKYRRDLGSRSTLNGVDESRSKRVKVVKNFGSNFITYNIENEPLYFRQAMNSSLPESRYWKGPLKSEIDCIVEFVRHYARMRLDMMIENMFKMVCDYYFKL